MLSILILFALASLPVVILVFYLYNKDKEKEPKKLLIKLFIGGIFSTILTLILSDILGSIFPILDYSEEQKNIFELFIYVFIGVALVEEFSKWIFVYEIGYKSKEFDHPYDILLYAGIVALGFAFLENILYVLDGGISTAIIRTFTAVPGHACDGIFMGYYLSLAKTQELKGNIKEARKYLILSIFIPMLLHGGYDFCIMSNLETIVLGFIVILIGQIKFTVKQVNNISKINITKPNNIVQNIGINFCPKCGTKAIDKYCTKCGSKLK